MNAFWPASTEQHQARFLHKNSPFALFAFFLFGQETQIMCMALQLLCICRYAKGLSLIIISADL